MPPEPRAAPPGCQVSDGLVEERHHDRWDLLNRRGTPIAASWDVDARYDRLDRAFARRRMDAFPLVTDNGSGAAALIGAGVVLCVLGLMGSRVTTIEAFGIKAGLPAA
jgi:hypothetical protein